MKTMQRFPRPAALLVTWLVLMTGTVYSQSTALTISLTYPTNQQAFVTPLNLPVHVTVADSNAIQTLQFFAGGNSIGQVNPGGQSTTNATAANRYSVVWSNVLAGAYVLTARVTDSAGLQATSAPVNITVANPVVRPVPYLVSFWYPTNRQVFAAPATVGVHALVTDSNLVETMHYFANGTSIGTVSNSTGVILTNSTQDNPFYMSWSNVMAGSYALLAVATDRTGLTATSPPVTINVTNPVVRPAVYLYSPTNGSRFLAPTNLTIYARAVESGGTVATVQFFANSQFLGVVSNSNQAIYPTISTEPLFALSWPNVSVGSYSLKAVAMDTLGNATTSAVVSITVYTNTFPPPPVPYLVSFWYPTNGQIFAAPATIAVHAWVTDSNLVATMQYFANGISLGLISNSTSVILTNSTQGNPFLLSWSNVVAGSYSLLAVATDRTGLLATSAPVNITVTNPVVRPAVYLYSPINGARFLAPANLTLYARAVETGGTVATVQFFANSQYLGVVSNSNQAVYPAISTEPLFALSWPNVSVGNYSLKAVAIDTLGNATTSAMVSITVYTNTAPPPPVPYLVSFWYPTNGQVFLAPATIGVHALATDSNLVATMQYFANGSSIGTVSNKTGVVLTNSTEANPFFLAWSNVPAGSYALQAVASDSAGLTATSAPVTILVVTSLPPVVSIYAPDPVAIEGTNYVNWYYPPSTASNYVSGANTATFLVHRDGATNAALTVNYAIGGTAINGEDYAEIASAVTIPAGKTYALITIVPLDDGDSSYRYYDTVTLSLLVPPTTADVPPPYQLGSPRQAGAIILEENFIPMVQPVIRPLADNSLHVSLPATNGLNFCLQISPDMVNWLPVCTNTVLKGSAQFVDPNPSAGTGLFYRIVPVATPANY